MVAILTRTGKLKPRKVAPDTTELTSEINIMHVIKLDKELGLLKFVVDSNVLSLKECGLLSSEQAQVFRVKNNGLQQMDMIFVAPECVNGRSLRDRERTDRLQERNEQEALRLAEEQAREGMEGSIRIALERCRNVLRNAG
jgi:hypothetical protein